jgi:iron-sulfur cluster repair protein YtfE (RIC family)
MVDGERRSGVTEQLGADHDRLDDELGEVKRALAAGGIAGARARFPGFREGLERHIDAEEQVLFPVFEELTGMATGGPTAVMRSEHAELRKRMEAIARRLEAGGRGDHAAPLAELTALVLAHNGKEERILYPTTDELARRAGKLGELMRRLEAALTEPGACASARRGGH